MYKVGDIIFLKSDSVASHVIRFVTTGRWNQNVPSHVAIICDLQPDTMLIESAFWGGVRIVPLSMYDNDTKWFCRMCPPRNIDRGIRWAKRQLGKKYDYSGIIGLAIRAVLMWLGYRGNLLDNKMAFWCSEFVAVFAKRTGKTLWHAPPNETTPYDLFRSKEVEYYKLDIRR